MLNLASFLTPLAVKPDPNGGVANANAGLGGFRQKQEEENRLANQKSEFGEEMGLRKKTEQFNEDESKRNFDQHVKELHTELIRRGMEYADKEGLDKARKLYGPIWDSAGIGVDFGDTAPPDTKAYAAPTQLGPPMTEEEQAQADLEDAQKKRGDLSEYTPPPAAPGSTAPKPGESLSAYVARNTKVAPTPPVAKQAPTVAPEEPETPSERATEGPEATEKEEVTAEATGAKRPWRIYNKATGESYGTIDPDGLDQINQKRARDRAQAYTTGTPEAGKPIVEGFTGAARNPGEVEQGMGHAERAISEQEKTLRVEKNHKGGGAGPVGGLDPKLVGSLNDDELAHMRAAVTNAGVPKLNQAANDTARIADLASSPVAMDQKLALGQTLKSIFGAAASEGERRFIFGSEGEFERIKMMANDWLEHGQVPPGLRESLLHAAHKMHELAANRARAISESTAEDILNDPQLGGRLKLTPEQREARKRSLVDVGVGGSADSANSAAEKMGF